MTAQHAARLDIRSVAKRFGNRTVLDGVSTHAAPGEIVCLLGASGSGKSTLLRIVAGLERADGGDVLVDGASIVGTPVHQRGFGLMFQDFALFPHRNVGGNVAFGLRMQGLPASEISRRVSEMLTLVNLPGSEARAIATLSGGEKQRIALARSLAPRPRLLMLDEPLGSLDRLLRDELLHDLRAVLKQAGITALYVTHDQAEAFAIGDRVVLLHNGVIAQDATPAVLYAQPASEYVARFLGFTNVLDGVVLGVRDGMLEVDCALGRLQLSEFPGSSQVGKAVKLLVRPEAARLGSSGTEFALRSAQFQGARVLVRAAHGALELEFALDDMPPQVFRAVLNPRRISLIP